MKTERWRRLLAEDPELRRLLDEVVRENPELSPHREALGLQTDAPARTGDRFTPFSADELAQARAQGW